MCGFIKIIDYLKNPKTILESIWFRLRFLITNDVCYVKIMYRLRMGRGDIENPKTFSEKLQWLKLYYRNPAYSHMVDKIEAKKYVGNLIGEEHIIHSLGVWDRPEDINFDNLPNQFVLKCNHNSGLGMCICRDKTQLNFKRVRKYLKKGLKENYYLRNREWPYKNVSPRILAEEYLRAENDDLKDYKFFCFNGEPTYCQVIGGRNTLTTSDFFDMNWNHQPFHEPYNYPFSSIDIPCPNQFEKMKGIAIQLSKGIPFVRVDLYEVRNKVYFGELTFFPTSGMGGFSPNDWDLKLGEMIILPSKILSK